MKTEDLYWLAGLLEGEGCFAYQCSPGIKLGMTDKDVVERAAALFGRHVRGPYRYKANKKPVYYTEVWSVQAIELMQQLRPLMGVRRGQKIDQIFRRWNKSPASRKPQRQKANQPAICHPDRKSYAHRLCVNCYQLKLYYKRKGE